MGAVGVALAAARARRAVERFSAVKIPGLRMQSCPSDRSAWSQPVYAHERISAALPGRLKESEYFLEFVSSPGLLRSWAVSLLTEDAFLET